MLGFYPSGRVELLLSIMANWKWIVFSSGGRLWIKMPGTWSSLRKGQNLTMTERGSVDELDRELLIFIILFAYAFLQRQHTITVILRLSYDGGLSFFGNPKYFQTEELLFPRQGTMLSAKCLDAIKWLDKESNAISWAWMMILRAPTS